VLPRPTLCGRGSVFIAISPEPYGCNVISLGELDNAKAIPYNSDYSHMN
jgi:hypothetical protein